MQLSPIKVECYAGHKADETPRRICWQGRQIEVAEVTDRWYQAAGNSEWPMADYFRVLGEDGNEYLLKRDHESDEWFLAGTICGARVENKIRIVPFCEVHFPDNNRSAFELIDAEGRGDRIPFTAAERFTKTGN